MFWAPGTQNITFKQTRDEKFKFILKIKIYAKVFDEFYFFNFYVFYFHIDIKKIMIRSDLY